MNIFCSVQGPVINLLQKTPKTWVYAGCDGSIFLYMNVFASIIKFYFIVSANRIYKKMKYILGIMEAIKLSIGIFSKRLELMSLLYI